MVKRLELDEEARRSLKNGIDTLAMAVRMTLGPKGRNVTLNTKDSALTTTHQGLTVANEIELENPFENMGAQLLKDAATKTADLAGDGTTTATVLAQSLVNEGLKNLAAGANPMRLSYGIEKGTEIVVDAIRSMAIPLKTSKDFAQIAITAANDETMGNLISEVIEKVSINGSVIVEPALGSGIETEYVEGMQIDGGYISAYFVTDVEGMKASINDPYILITDKKISAVQDILPLLEQLTQQGRREIVIIAEDVDGEALATLVVNKLRGILNVLAVKAPGFGDRRKEILYDIAILTGGQVVGEEIGKTSLADLGQALRVVATKDNTIIAGGHGDSTSIEARISQIRQQIEAVTSDYDREKLQERLAKLSGKVALIKVGAGSEIEQKYRQTLIENALSATKAAIEEGIVPGGGVALLNASKALDQIHLAGDAAIGVNILRRALEEPLRQLAINSGSDGSIVVERVQLAQKGHNDRNFGFNVLTGTYENMFRAGIVDPAKVTHSALQSAASIASMILKTEVLITDLPEKEAYTGSKVGVLGDHSIAIGREVSGTIHTGTGDITTSHVESAGITPEKEEAVSGNLPSGGQGGEPDDNREPPPPPDNRPEVLDSDSGEPPTRYVNSWFEGHPGPLTPLRFGEVYDLSIQVSAELREGTFTAGHPEFSEPEFDTQEMLDVVVAIVTDDFELLDRPCQRMQLPKDKAKTSSVVSFKVKPIKNNQDVYISVLFYHENNLFHEALIRAQVQVIEARKDETIYMPTKNVFQGSMYGRRDVNLQVIESENGYRFILFYDFGGDQFNIMWCKIPFSREKLARLLKSMHDDVLEVVHTKLNIGDGKYNEIFFDGEPSPIPFSEGRLPNLPSIDDAVYASSLTSLAQSGYDLYMGLFNPNRGSASDRKQARKVGEALRELSTVQPLKIQILSEEFFIPWNLLYDGEYPSDELKVDSGEFWGFKHTLEEVPYRTLEGEASGLIDPGGSLLTIGMNINHKNIPEGLTKPQLALLQRYETSVFPRYTEKEVREALQGVRKEGECALEYFYCHAGTGGNPEGSFDRSYLGLTSAKTGLTLKEIQRLTAGTGRKGRFKGNPLFILNACESVRMDGRFYDGFVPQFLGMGASAIVGTDCELPSLFGAHFGTAFLELVCQGVSIGEALLFLRKQFLVQNRYPLGLIYRVFGNADVRLSKPILQSNTTKEI